jgi:putative salt-induced outer membrane protein
MTMLRSKLITGLSLGLMSVPLVASAAWTGKGELGAALSNASTGASSTTMAAKFDVASEVDRWKHGFGGSLVYAKAQAEATATTPNPTDEATANRWELHWQSDYKLSDRSYVFGGVRHENDEIGSYEYQQVLAAGYGYKFVDTEATKLAGQLGVGYKRFKSNTTGAKSDSEPVFTGSLLLEQVLTANTKLIDKLAVEYGSTNALLTNDLAVQVKMSDVLSMAVGHQIRYNTEPGLRSFGGGEYAHTDRLLTLNLVYDFK